MSQASSHSNALTFKIIIIGDSNVGKTCLANRLCKGNFSEIYQSTIGVGIHQHIIEIEKQKINLQLWDTAGQERMGQILAPNYYRNTRAVVLVYDVSDKSSFDSLQRWIDECTDYCSQNVLKVLIGNKCDKTTEVNSHVAKQFADKFAMPFYLTSAKSDKNKENIRAIFLLLSSELLKQDFENKKSTDSRTIKLLANSEQRARQIEQKQQSDGWSCC